MTNGKAPLDNRTHDNTAKRAERFAEIERQRGQTIGRKEMAMTRRARAEDTNPRVQKFVEIARQDA